MELSFQTVELREICEKRERALAAFGESTALELEERLADVMAVDTADELAALFPEVFVLHHTGDCMLHLSTGAVLLFCPGHVYVPQTPTGAVAWDRVTRLRLRTIEASHA